MRIFAILSAIVIMFLLIGSVSATDIDANDTQIISANDADEIVSVENDFDTLNTNASTYSELANEIGFGGNIELKHDYYTYDNGSTIKITTDNSVIDGKGATIDMAGSTIQAFNVSASGVTIKNLTIKNAHYDGNGGAFYFFSGGGEITSCNFTNNTATYGGGAVYFYQNGKLTNCDFTNNTASNGYGGAAYFRYDSTGIVENCNFNNNKATENGGALFASTGTVTNCNFANNNATGGGGAVYFFIDGGEITNCNFTNNSVTYSGGAIYMYSGTVTNCNFANNNATEEGGAVYIYQKGEVTNCNFIGNIAAYGSAIYKSVGLGNITIFNSLFLNNRANVNSFPLTIVKSENNIKIIFKGQNNLLNAIYSRCSVNFTNVTYWGANGITNTGFSPTVLFGFNKEAGQNITVILVVNNSIVLNTTKVTDDDGQIIFDLPIADNYTIIARHDADSYYTQAETTRLSTGPITYSELASEIGSGGNIELKHDYYKYTGGDTIEITTDNSIIDGNGAIIDMVGLNQAFKVYASGVTIKNLTIKNANYSDGGAIYFNEPGVVENCNFTNNVAYWRGGAIFMYSGTIKNCNFTGNIGGFYNDEDYYNMFGTDGVSYGGGAITMYEGTVTNCIFTNNNASRGYGGAILGSDIVTNCNFINNIAQGGGAIDMYQGTVKNCNFINNIAQGGGAIDMYQGTVKNCNFTNNSATYGGAIRFTSVGNVTNCIFTNNNASGGYGGAILINTGNITNCNFTNNKACNGGAIDISSGTVERCSFIACSASNYGGGIYFNPESCRIYDCYFKDNIAKNGSDWYSKYDIKNELGASTSLEVPSVTATYAVSKKLTVTLKDVNGNALESQNIIVKVGTISKTLITDSNGQASIDVSTLIPETYSADIIFAGDDKYNASSATAKVTVKKATPKLTAKAKTFKKSVKTKKYTITLKNNKNKVMKNTKVTIKVNKKTYTAKTNSKGVATFKITKLNKKGTFKSTVTYNGNKYYNKVTKKVNIKIK